MTANPRIIGFGTAHPSHDATQEVMLADLCDRVLGPNWAQRPEAADKARQMARTFAASGVEHRQGVINFGEFYSRRRTTGERMAEYQRSAGPLARAALEASLREAPEGAVAAISDFIVVSCTGYSAPGLDILLARDLGMPHDVRRVVVGHMGCYGALVGLRQALAAARAHPGAVVALVCVELCSLHFMPSLNPEVVTCYALFGDAAAAVLLTMDGDDSAPELVDTYCAAAFDAIDQMSWTVTDEGFVMGLSPRVPVTLRRHVGPAVERLLAPHGLTAGDVSHWAVHPGGPSILEVVQAKLELSDYQMAPSWTVLREHGNCSAPTVLLILDALLRERRPRRGEWGVMMAFGPGLTLETCLLRF